MLPDSLSGGKACDDGQDRNVSRWHLGTSGLKLVPSGKLPSGEPT